MRTFFTAAAGACKCTLGITTCIELELTEAQPYVETTYHAVKSMKEAREVINEACRDPSLEYVDGILFSENRGAVITGRLTNEIAETPGEIGTRPGVASGALKTQSFSRPQDPWFYQHVEEKVDRMLSMGGSAHGDGADIVGGSDGGPPTMVETIEIAEYLFRYDRGGFWVGDSAFKYTKFPNTKLTRWFLDDFLHTRMLYRALHASGQARQYMVQDLALPDDTVEEFVEFAAEQYGIWPLWLCPLKHRRRRLYTRTTVDSAEGARMPRAVKAMTNGAGRGMPSAPCLMWAFGASPKVAPTCLNLKTLSRESGPLRRSCWSWAA